MGIKVPPMARAQISLTNNTSKDLTLAGDRTGGINQNWVDVPDSIQPGPDNFKDFHVSDGIDFVHGVVKFNVLENGATLKMDISQRASNAFSFDVNGENFKFRSKIGVDGSWSDWGTVVQGKGDLYVDAYLG